MEITLAQEVDLAESIQHCCCLFHHHTYYLEEQALDGNVIKRASITVPCRMENRTLVVMISYMRHRALASDEVVFMNLKHDFGCGVQ